MLKQITNSALIGLTAIGLGVAGLQYTGMIDIWPGGPKDVDQTVTGIDDAKAGQVGALGRLDIDNLEQPEPNKLTPPKVKKKAAILPPMKSNLPTRRDETEPKMTPVEDLPDNIPSHLPQPDAPKEVVDINKTREISATSSDF